MGTYLHANGNDIKNVRILPPVCCGFSKHSQIVSHCESSFSLHLIRVADRGFVGPSVFKKLLVCSISGKGIAAPDNGRRRESKRIGAISFSLRDLPVRWQWPATCLDERLMLVQNQHLRTDRWQSRQKETWWGHSRTTRQNPKRQVSPTRSAMQARY